MRLLYFQIYNKIRKKHLINIEIIALLDIYTKTEEEKKGR